jgi:hypothetical protein
MNRESMNLSLLSPTRVAILTTTVAIVLVGSVLVVSPGCGPTKTQATKPTSAKTATDPWEKLTLAFRNDVDAPACRQLLAELNGGLAVNAEAERPRTAPASEIQPIVQALRLTEVETKFLGGGEYTPLDAQYLSECLYLKDAAASLGLDAADPTPVRAAIAFNWVCRQVQLRPWLIDIQQGKQAQPPLPPAFVLRRGSGSALERAYTFLALCRQLDLDACLVGHSADDRLWTYTQESEPKGYPEGPFWAVGVRDGNDVLLFDPVRGVVFSGKGTLTELRANPSALAEWRKDEKNKWTVTDDQMKAAELYLTAPISAFAPRTATLDQKLRGETGARLWVDWKAMTDRLTKAGGGAKVKTWNPPQDAFTPVRVLDTILPNDQGGGSFGPDGSGVLTEYNRSLIPLGKLFAFPPELTSDDVRQRLQLMGVSTYSLAFQPQLANRGQVALSPREKIQRGKHVEATRELIEQRDFNVKAQRRRDTVDAATVTKALTDWAKEAQRLYDQLSRARVADDQAIQVPFAQKQIEEFWLKTLPVQNLVMADLLARPAGGEATFLLATSFHERAERSQVEAERAVRMSPTDAATTRQQAKADWKSAKDWWQRYEEYRQSQDESYPGRAAHAKKMADRAEKLSGGD